MLIDPHVPPSPLPPHTELLDPVPVLAYAAAVTERILLGTGIVILPLRNPVILAKELATVDVLSRGRLMVGIGVGYVPGEYEAIGVPFDTRGHRADEWIDSLRTLWRDDQPEFRGDFASFGGIQCRPQPHRPGGPPILGSGMSTPARRRAVARCEGWYGFFQDLDNTRAAHRRARPPRPGGRPPRRARPARDHHHAGPRPDRPRHRPPLRGPRGRPPGRPAGLRRHGGWTGRGATWQVPRRDDGVRRASRHPLTGANMATHEEMVAAFDAALDGRDRRRVRRSARARRDRVAQPRPQGSRRPREHGRHRHAGPARRRAEHRARSCSRRSTAASCSSSWCGAR